MSGANRVQAVLDGVKPLVLAQNFAEVCERLAAETTTAVSEKRHADAASLSAMLASFRSITGDEQKALEALERAEELEPGNAHRAVSTAEHLFARMDRKDDAVAKTKKVLAQPEVDSPSKHEALALLGRVAVKEGRLQDACELLQQSFDAAVAGDLEAMFWDRALPRAIVETGARVKSTRAYLEELLRRAEAESDDHTKGQVLKILTEAAQAEGQRAPHRD